MQCDFYECADLIDDLERLQTEQKKERLRQSRIKGSLLSRVHNIILLTLLSRVHILLTLLSRVHILIIKGAYTPNTMARVHILLTLLSRVHILLTLLSRVHILLTLLSRVHILLTLLSRVHKLPQGRRGHTTPNRDHCIRQNSYGGRI